MANDDFTSKQDSRELLHALGIPAQSLPLTDFDESDSAALYQHLQPLMSSFATRSLELKESWQLCLLTGRLRLIFKLDHTITSLKDSWGANAAHYIALSGKPEALRWINKYNSQLLEAKNYNGENIAHYAAWSGSPEALTWIKKHKPKLLKAKSHNGETIAHYAALSGNVEALNWIKKHKPKLLEARSYKGETIAHYAALSGNFAVVNWIKNNKPQLLTVSTDSHCSFVDYAAYTNTTQLKLALNLTKAAEMCLPFNYKLHPGRLDYCLQTISKILDSNLKLTSIKFPRDNWYLDIEKEIRDKLAVNKAIEELMPALIQVVVGYYEEGNQLYRLPRDILFETFKQILPPSVPKAKASVVFNNLLTSLEPVNQFKRKVINLIDKEIAGCLAAQKDNYFDLIKGYKGRIKVLKQIKNVLDKRYESLDELRQEVINVFALHQDTLKPQQNYSYSLFKPMHQPKTINLAQAVSSLLAIDLGTNPTMLVNK